MPYITIQSLRGRAVARGRRAGRSAGVEPLERRVLLSSSVLFTSDFEAGTVAGWRDYDLFGNGTIGAAAAPAPVRAGRYPARFTLPAGGQRSEVADPADPAGSERWYAFSTYLPADWRPHPLRDILAQWREFPDWDGGEVWRIPPLSLSVVNGDWQVANRWESKPVNNSTWNPAPPTGGRKEWYLPYQKGAWTDWVFHVKWSYQSTGLMEVWRTGNKVITRAGPNTYNDETGNYFKLGLYHPDFKLDTHPVTPLKTVYHDEVRLGGPAATYDDVRPGRAPDSPLASVTINGTGGRDTIRVTQSGTTLTVNNNGAVSTIGTVGKARLVVNGGDGDDTILLDKSVTIDSVLSGGRGRDRLRGGAGADEFVGGDGTDAVDYADQTAAVFARIDDEWNDGPAGAGRRDNVRVDVENLFGGPGNDTLVGSYFCNVLVGNGGDDVLRDGGSRDVLIGGAGRDQLTGGGGEDLLIGSRTAYDANYAALQTLQSEWQRGTVAHADRISRLRAGAAGGVRLDAATVVDDGVGDVLTGGTGKDWWVARRLDTVADLGGGEVATRL